MRLILLLALCSTVALSTRHHTTKWQCSVTALNTSVHVDCSDRNLKDIPEKLPWNVTELNLSGNQIKYVAAVPLRQLFNLTVIDLNSNFIEYFDNKEPPFLHCEGLKTLLFDHNKLSKVPRQLPVRLSNLSLASNQINSVKSEDFANLSLIESINLDNNCYFHSSCNGSLMIENGTFSNLNHLTNLSLTMNRLQKVPQYLPESLMSLKLLLNTIAHINKSDFSGLTSLRFLDLSGNCPFCPNAPFPCKPCGDNGLVIHPQAFAHLAQLEELRLSGNSLQTVNSAWFRNLTRLQYLFLSFNFLITEIQTGSFLSMLPHVEVIDLSYNNLNKALFPRLNISQHFANMTSLRALHLQGYYFSKLLSDDLKPLYNLRNLTVLNMGVNFLQKIDFSFLKLFYNLSVFTLVENQLTNLLLTPESSCCLTCGKVGASGHSDLPILFRPYIHRDEDYRFYPPSIKPECVNAGNVLDLSRNLIFNINPKLFSNTENIACLNLSSNSIGETLNGSEFRLFPKLKYLDLSRNRLYLSSDQAFTELPYLEILDLNHNKHYFQVVGLNHSLAFTRYLKSLKVLYLNWNEISSLTEPHMHSTSLQKLYFAGNQLDMMWRNSQGFNLFKNLTNLQTLDLSLNGLKSIPNSVYENLPDTLTYLRLNQNGLLSFNWTVLSCLPRLEELHLSKNELDHVTASLSSLTRQLKVLDLSHNRIAQLSGLLLSATLSLRILDLSHNSLTTLNATTFQTGQPDSLQTLRLENNPFRCTCDLLDFILWIRYSPVSLPNLVTKVQCNLPESKRGRSIMLSDIDICLNDDLAQILYTATSSIVILVLSIAVCAHLFYWDVSYIFSFLRAKVKSQRPNSAQYMYNAFIMYDTSDPLASDWVLHYLRVELEECGGERARPLCLEERDWIPGMPVLDNLSQSVRLSRKTVFVLTESFLGSSLFKMAVFLAHQRLLEEGVDVMVLLQLQPVLQRSRILGLRRCLRQSSVLEWPVNPAAHSWFWQQLRSAVLTERPAKHSSLHRRYFSGR
ncbi:toll-like receptor 8b [Alosa sapidissima]|uniref:toll-like receptor 8b n=1 Tax=Alosa sapidissima TaxID=34773 RepID=UPI001C085167|nr:toll-like receptor 8b [Alosa sapidissima]